MSVLIEFVLVLVAFIDGIEIKEGWASQYETQQLMLDTVKAQQGWGHLPERLPDVDGFVAVADCKRIGDVINLYREGVGLETFLIADCSGHVETSNWMLENNILVEVDHETAKRWGVVGQGGVKVLEITFGGLEWQTATERQSTRTGTGVDGKGGQREWQTRRFAGTRVPYRTDLYIR